MLNRTTRAAALPAGLSRPEPEVGKECAEFEKCTAEATETLANGLEQITGKAFPMLHDASRDMLTAAEVLPAGRFAAAVPHDKEALSNLLKARNTVRQVLGKPQSKSSAEELRSFDRSQAQKLRRPKELDEKQAEQVAERLRRLAKQEEFVYATVSKQCEEPSKPAKSQSGDSGSQGQQQREEKAEAGKEQKSASPQRDRMTKDARERAKEGEEERRRDGAQQDGKGKGDGGEADVKKRQSEIVEESRAVQQALDRLAKQPGSPGLSELADARMNKAVEKAEATATALDHGNRNDAAKSSREAATKFGELAVHIEGLLGRDVAGRLASARDLAARLAERQRERAEREAAKADAGLTESVQTLEDVLRGLTRSGDKGSIRPEMLEEIEKLLRETDVSSLVKRMEQAEAKAGEGRRPEARTEGREIADRLEILAQRLEVLHRLVVAPRLEALIALEKRAAALAERLKRLESQAAIAQWHREADAVLQELARLAPNAAVTARLSEAMRHQGWGTDWVGRDWRYVEGYWLPPDAYTTNLNQIVSDLQQQIGEMLLRETVSGADEPTPPQYKELVERYFQILSQRGSRGK